MQNDKPTVVTDYQYQAALSYLTDPEEITALIDMKITYDLHNKGHDISFDLAYNTIKSNLDVFAYSKHGETYGSGSTNTKRKHQYPWYKQIK